MKEILTDSNFLFQQKAAEHALAYTDKQFRMAEDSEGTAQLFLTVVCAIVLVYRSDR